MLKLIYYVPESHLEETKLAVFAAGAGGIGNYEHCAWQVLGTGQFKPVKGANPFIGELDALEHVAEWRSGNHCTWSKMLRQSQKRSRQVILTKSLPLSLCNF